MEEALGLFRQLGDMWGISQALNGIGDIERASENYDRASSFYMESLHLYRQLGVKRDIPASLHNLGQVALASNNSLKAAEFFKESLRLHLELGNKNGIAECLVGLASVATALRQTARAARLLGICALMREQLELSMWPAEQVMYEHNISTTHAELDEAGWMAAWNEGQAMSLEAAVEYALE